MTTPTTLTLSEIPITKITAHPKNVRRDVTADPELIASVKEQGILQPIGVVAAGKKYLLIAGHRRVAAAKAAKLKTVPAVVHEHLTTEAQQIEAMLVENGRRVDLTPIEEAEAYEQLTLLGVDIKDIAKTTGRSAQTVKQRLALTRLPKKAASAVHGHQITLTQAEGLLQLEPHPGLLKETLAQLGRDNFDYVVRNAVRQGERLDEEANLREEYSQKGLPEIKRPKNGWDYNKGPRPAQDGEVADAWYPGGTDYWDTAPQLIVTKVAERKKTAQEIKWERERAKEQAEWKERQAAEQLARRMRMEHVVTLAGGMAVPDYLKPHLHAGVARIVADMTNGEIDDVASASGVELERAKGEYHNDTIAKQILELSTQQLLAVLGAAIASKATGHLYLGYGEHRDLSIENATAYWATFDQSGYELPDIDKTARKDLSTEGQES